MRFLEERGEGCAILDCLAGSLDGQWRLAAVSVVFKCSLLCFHLSNVDILREKLPVLVVDDPARSFVPCTK